MCLFYPGFKLGNIWYVIYMGGTLFKHIMQSVKQNWFVIAVVDCQENARRMFIFQINSYFHNVFLCDSADKHILPWVYSHAKCR